MNIAIFASGTGTNARNIIQHFKEDTNINIVLIVSNKSTAPVLDIAAAHNIPSLLIKRDYFYNTQEILKEFEKYNIDFIVLAGFLWLIPSYLIASYPRRIINLHPALLPKYGGKGMYGMNVHRAVVAAGETQTGITIHYVNEVYDDGEIILQATCEVSQNETVEQIAHKIHQLEYKHFPLVIAKLAEEDNC